MEDRITRWTFRDIFLSLGLALDPILLGIAYVGLLTGGAAYGFLYFLGNATRDPGARGTFSILGGILFVCVWILTSGILARVVATHLLEGRKSTAREVWEYFIRRARALLLIPACFAGVVLATLGGVGVFELLGRIPGLGPIFFGASFTFVFLLGLAAVTAFILHTLVGLLYPTILAVRRDGVLSTVREILSLARGKAVLLLIYSVVILTAGAVALLFLLILVWLALAVVTSSAHNLMGEEFDSILAGLPSSFHPFVELLGAGIGPVPADMDVAWHYDLAGLLVGISLLSIFAATAAYPAVMANSAGTIAYFILTDVRLPDRLPLPGEPEASDDQEDLEPDEGRPGRGGEP